MTRRARDVTHLSSKTGAVKPASVDLVLRVTPRAGRSLVAGQRDGVWQVRLAAAPVDGAANAALLELLSEVLDLPRRQITIVSGETGRHKRVRIDGLTMDDVEARLARAAARHM